MSKEEFRSKVIALELDESISYDQYLRKLDKLVKEYINA